MATLTALRFAPLIACLAVLAGAAAGVAATMETRRAVVSLRDADPLTVRGIYFKRRERVTVRVTAETLTYTRRATANRIGSFTVVFRGVRADPCSLELMVIRRGGVVQGKVPERMCPMPLGPGDGSERP